MSDLPNIQRIRHASAQQLRLRVDGQQIRLTVPRGCSERQIQQFLQQSTPWLQDIWQQLQQQQTQHHLPDQLRVFNVDMAIDIVYQQQRRNFHFAVAQQTLYISDRNPQRSLNAFVRSYAKQHLPMYLQQVADECQLEFQDCQIRQPKTRWGSCSAQQQIMLHSALILCAIDVVRYVCVHELAHTREFNHSAKFWQVVAQHQPDYRQHIQQLKAVRLPTWWQVGSKV